MSVSQTAAAADERTSRLGVTSVLVFVALSAYVFVLAPAQKLLGIAWFAFAAMALGAVLGAFASTEHPTGLVWGYGLASGAMVTSAAVFLVPEAIAYEATAGGVGVAAGLLTGFGAHTIGHRLTHLDLPLDRTSAELTAHGIGDGLIVGVVYTAMPALGVLLGLTILSHKAPAGYAASRRLATSGRSTSVLLLPAASSGLAALAASLFSLPDDPTFLAVVFGFAAGIFLHVAMDFLPHCETGGDVHDAVTSTGHDHNHALLDSLRLQAVLSTALGGLLVLATFFFVQ